jgi:lipoprotein-anchoring transpeptidase ErfK/SrfK
MKDLIKKYQSISGIGSISIAAAGRHSENPPNSDDANWRSYVVRPVLVLLVVLIGFFIGTTHGSLAPIYFAGQRIHATISQHDLQSRLTGLNAQYKLQLKYPDGSTKRFRPTAAGVTVNVADSVTQAKYVINHSWLQRLTWWRPIDIPLKTQTDTKRMQSFVDSMATQITVPVKDASLSIDGGAVQLTAEVVGHGNHVAGGRASILRTIQSFQTVPLSMSPFTIEPKIHSKDIVKSQEQAQDIIKQSVAFTIEDNVIHASPEVIAGWLELSPVTKDRTVDVTVNSGKVLDYINKLAGRYVSQPRSRLVANVDSGQIILDYGADGVDVVHKDQTASHVAHALQSKQPVNEPLVVDYAAAKTVVVPAYDKWFVADVTNKRMYAYEKTALVRTFLISAGAPATPTVLGDYSIYRKYESQDMTGDNADGSRYFQPAVPYVNYFYGGYAIHGNYWRPESWFGNINSSHGCIGIDVSDAKWIYDWAGIGTHVIVHT